MIVHIEDLRAGRRALLQRERDGSERPGVGIDGKYLLIDALAVDHGGIGVALVRRRGQLGGIELRPRHAARIDGFSRRKHTLRRRLICASEVGVDAETADRPVAEEVDPQRGLGGVVSLLLRLEPQCGKIHMRVSVADDAAHLGIGHGRAGAVLDGCAFLDLCRHATQPRIGAVGRDLARFSTLRR